MRAWHITGAAIGALLGSMNLLFWEVFILGDALAAGYFATSLHWLFFALETAAALAASGSDSRALPAIGPAE